MTTFNITDYRAATHYTEETDQREASKALQPLIDFMHENDCLDLALQLLESSKKGKATIEYSMARDFLTSFNLNEVGAMVQIGDSKLMCTELMLKLAHIMRDSLIDLHWCKSLLMSDEAISVLLDVLLELKERKSAQGGIKSWLRSFVPNIGWKTGVGVAVSLAILGIAAICFFKFDAISLIISSIL